jgi:hypothetical protein
VSSYEFCDLPKFETTRPQPSGALPKEAVRCKEKTIDVWTRPLTNPKTHVADDFPAEALLQFSQDFGLGNLLELAVQSWLEHADLENPIA